MSEASVFQRMSVGLKATPRVVAYSTDARKGGLVAGWVEGMRCKMNRADWISL